MQLTQFPSQLWHFVPQTDNVELRSKSRLLNKICLVAMVALTVAAIMNFVQDIYFPGVANPLEYAAMGAALMTMALSAIHNRRMQYTLASRLLVGGTFISATALSIYHFIWFTSLLGAVIVAAMLLSERETIIMAVLSLIIPIVYGLLGIQLVTEATVVMPVYFLVVMLPLLITYMVHTRELERERRLILERANQRLQESEEKLEQRVQERTHDLKLAREDAERANRVKSAFLASMSHELRTPLNAIINFSKFLKKGIPGPVNEEQESLVSSIADSGQHLLNLINDVLDMSKIEAGSLKLYVESDIDVQKILETATQYTRPLLSDKPVEMMIDIPAELPKLTGDRKRLLQIFLNILSNACKFTDEGYVKVSVLNEADRVLIKVEDTGAGIAPDDADHVFTAFKQTESGLRQGGGGTGLGMPICQKLVEAHDGQIWFESQLQIGTTFYVALPYATERSNKNV